MKNILMVLSGMFFLSSCVAKRYLTQSQAHVASLQSDSTKLQNKNYDFQNQVTKMEASIASLNKEIDALSSKNTRLGQLSQEQQDKLTQKQKDLQQQQEKLEQLQSLLARQKQASEALKNKMTEALKGFNSSDLSVYQKDGKVFVSLSENLLFPSASAVVNPKGVDALSKLAAVLNIDTTVSVEIEGHTDSIPIRGKFQDNWALSTARANSIVRILVNRYSVDPHRVVATGHSYYDPIATNSTPEGRSKNRRTEIILSPNLEKLYDLLQQ